MRYNVVLGAALVAAGIGTGTTAQETRAVCLITMQMAQASVDAIRELNERAASLRLTAELMSAREGFSQEAMNAAMAVASIAAQDVEELTLKLGQAQQAHMAELIPLCTP